MYSVESMIRQFAYNPETGVVTRKENSTVRRWRAGMVAGGMNGQGYIEIKVAGKCIGAHRIAWMVYYKEDAPEFIDHINRIPSDNRITNLRPASKSQNGANRSALSNNTEGIKGCYFVKSKNENLPGRWRAQCRVGKKLHDLGRHRTIEQAQTAYNEFASKAFGEYFSPA